MQSTHVSKELFGIRGTHFDVRVEYNEDFIIVHLPKVEKMNKATFNEMKKLLEDWLEFVKTVGYPCIFTGIEPHKEANRLALLLGFKYLGDNQGYRVYSYGEQ